MGINRGKQFEGLLREQFEKVPDTLCLRLYDVTMGYSNINNPCDLIVYKDNTLNLFECKAIHGNTLNFKSHIRENQWNKLLQYSKIPGVNAGILCWFIDVDETAFLPIECLQYLVKEGNKSFNITKELDRILMVEIKGRKKKVFFEYNLKKLLEDISYE